MPDNETNNQQEGIPPMPVPTMFSVIPARLGEEGVVALELQTPTGSHITFWDPDTAEAMAKELTKIARQARSGLVLPPTGLIRG